MILQRPHERRFQEFVDRDSEKVEAVLNHIIKVFP